MDNVQMIESGLECDNPDCNWRDKTILQKDYKNWVNRLCPHCGDNLLTKEDFISSLGVMKIVDFINSLDDEAIEEYNRMVMELSDEEKSALLGFMGDTKMEDLEDMMNNLTDEDIVKEYSMKVKVHNGIHVESIKEKVFRSLVFEKDEIGDWYVVLPEWEGDKADLQMVCGADLFLDIMAQGEDRVTSTVSDLPFHEMRFTIQKKQDTPEIGGALYTLTSTYEQNMEMWLCDVTRFIFNGEMPETIFFS